MALTPEMWAWIGVILGVVARTLLPFYQKAQETPGLVFDTKYIVTAIIAVLGSLAMVPAVMAAFLAEHWYLTTVSYGWFIAFLGAFLLAVGANDLLNRLSQLYSPSSTSTLSRK